MFYALTVSTQACTTRLSGNLSQAWMSTFLDLPNRILLKCPHHFDISYPLHTAILNIEGNNKTSHRCAAQTLPTQQHHLLAHGRGLNGKDPAHQATAQSSHPHWAGGA